MKTNLTERMSFQIFGSKPNDLRKPGSAGRVAGDFPADVSDEKLHQSNCRT